MMMITGVKPKGGGGGTCSLLQSEIKGEKNTDFTDTMTLDVLHDLSFRRNQPLK
jgi:hypothetical protein